MKGSALKRMKPLRVPAACALLVLLGGCATPQPYSIPVVAPAAPGQAAPIEGTTRAAPGEQPAPPAEAPDGPLEVTVLQTLYLALENNRALSIERLNPPIVGTAVDIERAVFDPVVFFGLEAATTEAETRTGTTTRTHEANAGAGASVFLPSGTELGATAESGRTWGTAPDQYATRLGLSVTQALLRGASREANLVDLRQARIDVQLSMYELRGFAEALVAEVETTYWDYVLARRQVEIFEESLRLAEQQLSETGVRVRVGDLAETELAAARAEVALRHEGLINAKSRVAALQVRLLRLAAPARLAAGERALVPLSRPAVPVNSLDAVQDHVDLALRMRPDVNQARLLIRRGDLELVKTKNGLLPRMDLFATLGKTGYARSFGSSVGDIPRDGYDVGVGLSFEFPVHNRAARARHQAATLTRRQYAETMSNVEDLVREDVEAAHIEVLRARQQVDATAATRRFQEEKLRAETAKFNADKSTSLLVASAQRDLVGSQVAEVEAVTNYLKALTSLYLFDGSLLQRRGIRAPGEAPSEDLPADDGP